MVAKICIILIFVGVVVGVGIYARQHTKNVDGFVLGGRNVGPGFRRLLLAPATFRR